MSRRIENILEFVQEVREGFRAGNGTVEELRRQAAHSIAGRRRINYRTVLDTFRRQLEPDVRGVGEFDILLENWLVRGSQKLRDILLRYAADSRDEERINHAFRSAS